MQIDLHYYGIYALARAAGLKPEIAETIATASQFVDDNGKKVAIKFEDGARLDVEATAHHVADIKNIDEEDQRRIWVPFHFLPGNEGETYTERLICRQDSAIAQEMVVHHYALSHQPYFLELIGITAHVYADTFSHYGFSGVSSRRNKIINNGIELEDLDQQIHAALRAHQIKFHKKYRNEGGLLDNIKEIDHSPLNVKRYLRRKASHYARSYNMRWLEIVQSFLAETLSGALGHGAVVTFPDQPYLKWKFQYEQPQYECQRNNLVAFLAGCRALHRLFSNIADIRSEYTDPDNRKTFAAIEPVVMRILQTQEKDKYKRAEHWRQAAKAGAFFSPGADIPPYQRQIWFGQRDSLIKNPNSNIALNRPVYRFYQAASVHRVYILRDLLPAHELIVD
jgi:hypothetical protein